MPSQLTLRGSRLQSNILGVGDIDQVIGPLTKFKPVPLLNALSSHADQLRQSDRFPIVQVNRGFETIELQLSKPDLESGLGSLAAVSVPPMAVEDLISKVRKLMGIAKKDVEINLSN